MIIFNGKYQSIILFKAGTVAILLQAWLQHNSFFRIRKNELILSFLIENLGSHTITPDTDNDLKFANIPKAIKNYFFSKIFKVCGAKRKVFTFKRKQML